MKNKIIFSGFQFLTSIACEVVAFVCFYLVDWRIAAGYAFVWFGEMVSSEAVKSFRSGVGISSESVAGSLAADSDYRILERGEALQPGDEFYSPLLNSWRPYDGEAGVLVYSPEAPFIYRRRVK